MTKKIKLFAAGSRLAPAGERVRQGDSWRKDKGSSSSARLYNSEWQRYRADYLRDYPLCRMCQARGLLVEATHLDHIEPHRGDKALFWEPSNHAGLCEHCHNSHKQKLERGARRIW